MTQKRSRESAFAPPGPLTRSRSSTSSAATEQLDEDYNYGHNNVCKGDYDDMDVLGIGASVVRRLYSVG